jgi:hypothetical protein
MKHHHTFTIILIYIHRCRRVLLKITFGTKEHTKAKILGKINFISDINGNVSSDAVSSLNKKEQKNISSFN